MRKISRILSIILASVMLLSLAACSSPAEVQKTELELYVEENKTELEDSFVEGFESSGLSCTCEVSAVANTLYISCSIAGLDEVPEEVSQQLAALMESQKETFAEAFTASFPEELHADELVMNFCEEDDDLISSIAIPLS